MHMLRTLIDERGPWSANPFPNGSVLHWKLDKTEDTWRRRPKLRRNYHFDEKMCHPPSTSPCNEASLPSSESKSSLVGHIPEQMKQFLLQGVRRITDEGSSELVESGAEPSGQSVVLEDPSDSHSVEVVKTISDQMDIVQDRKEFSASSHETEINEVHLIGGIRTVNLCFFYSLKHLEFIVNLRFAVAGCCVSFMCACDTKKKIGRSIGSHERCLAFLW